MTILVILFVAAAIGVVIFINSRKSRNKGINNTPTAGEPTNNNIPSNPPSTN